uniref:FHA domain-containing protein n=1 Tax=Anopheles farauti TaxID=69004 RepID=A0A182QBR7_9DIPT
MPAAEFVRCVFYSLFSVAACPIRTRRALFPIHSTTSGPSVRIVVRAKALKNIAPSVAGHTIPVKVCSSKFCARKCGALCVCFFLCGSCFFAARTVRVFWFVLMGRSDGAKIRTALAPENVSRVH